MIPSIYPFSVCYVMSSLLLSKMIEYITYPYPSKSHHARKGVCMGIQEGGGLYKSTVQLRQRAGTGTPGLGKKQHEPFATSEPQKHKTKTKQKRRCMFALYVLPLFFTTSNPVALGFILISTSFIVVELVCWSTAELESREKESEAWSMS
ncbi:hypothetical protein F5Y17DRAFT_262199 [Xylariaceae sp. FL0594]|nr:hypothetical protein F5Y17DRAFT_262199 [Xylariaceae sp. FL0594]